MTNTKFIVINEALSEICNIIRLKDITSVFYYEDVTEDNPPIYALCIRVEQTTFMFTVFKEEADRVYNFIYDPKLFIGITDKNDGKTCILKEAITCISYFIEEDDQSWVCIRYDGTERQFFGSKEETLKLFEDLKKILI